MKLPLSPRTLSLSLTLSTLSTLICGASFAATEHDILIKSPDKDMTLFVNLNTNVHEREATMNAAKKLQTGYALIPSLKTDEELSPIYQKFMETKDRVNSLDRRHEMLEDRCNNRLDSCDPQAVKRAKVLLDEAQKISDGYDQQAIDFAGTHPLDIKKEFLDLTMELESQGLEVTHLILSGHNETGENEASGFSGDYLAVRKIKDAKLIQIMQEHPKVYGRLTFLGLWGCESVTHNQVDIFEKALPSIQVWAGYYDTAPAGIRPDSYQYLYGAMMHAESLAAISDPSLLKAAIKKVPSVDNVYSGMAVRLNHGEPYIYYKKEADDDSIQTRFEPVHGGARCKTFLAEEYPKSVAVVEKYLFGLEDIPDDTDHSALRNAYYEMSQNYDCYWRKGGYSPGKVGLLRFYQTFATNFDRTFATIITKAETELKLSPYYSTLQNEFPKLDLKHLDQVSRPMTMQFTKKLNELEGNVKPKSIAIQSLVMYLNRYLVDIDTKCVEFLEWHDDKHETLANAKCVLTESAGQLTWKIIDDDDLPPPDVANELRFNVRR